MYSLGCEEEEATTAAICRENERTRKVSVSDGGTAGGSLGEKVEKVIAAEAETCSADAAEQQVNMHDQLQLCFQASMGFSWNKLNLTTQMSQHQRSHIQLLYFSSSTRVALVFDL